MLKTRKAALEEAKRLGWKEPFVDVAKLCRVMGFGHYGEGLTWEDAFADAERRELKG